MQMQALPSPQQLRCAVAAEPLVFDGVAPHLCAALSTIILDRAAKTRVSAGSRNVGGWKSTEHFFTWPDQAVQQLRHALIGILGAVPVGWAMINRRGSFHGRHQHRIASVSGVYYVDPGEDPSSPTVCETPGGEIAIEPHPGRLVVFSGMTWHSVPRYDGEKPRITIAFDVRR